MRATSNRPSRIGQVTKAILLVLFALTFLSRNMLTAAAYSGPITTIARINSDTDDWYTVGATTFQGSTVELGGTNPSSIAVAHFEFDGIVTGSTAPVSTATLRFTAANTIFGVLGWGQPIQLMLISDQLCESEFWVPGDWNEPTEPGTALCWTTFEVPDWYEGRTYGVDVTDAVSAMMNGPAPRIGRSIEFEVHLFPVSQNLRLSIVAREQSRSHSASLTIVQS
jgi:hypothetical protein